MMRLFVRRPRTPLLSATRLERQGLILRPYATFTRQRKVYNSRQLVASVCSGLPSVQTRYPSVKRMPGACVSRRYSGFGFGAVAASLFNLVEKATRDNTIFLPPPMPTHYHQLRRREMRDIQKTYQSLRKASGKDVTIGVYIVGRPGFGKTQLAREYGKMHFQSSKGRFFRKLVVATLNASSPSSFLHSYIKLAMELNLVEEVRALDNFLGLKGDLHALELLSAAVRKELRKRPGWLLIIDNLSSEVMSINQPLAKNDGHSETTSVLPLDEGQFPSATTFPATIIQPDSPVLAGVDTAHGISSQKAAWRAFWPQPGDVTWGKGHVLVTTRDSRLVEGSNPAVGILELNEGMQLDDAVALLENVSGAKGEGAEELVTAVERVPLSVASAGFYIRAERAHRPHYSFQDYVQGLERGIQSESEQLLLTQNLSYPLTMTMALSMAADQLSSDPNLHKVFVLMAACGQPPVPMKLIAKMLGVKPDINSVVLEAVRSSALLYKPKRSPLPDEGMECVSLYRGTREVFRGLFLGDTVLRTDPVTGHVEFVHVNLQDRKDVHIQRRNNYLRQFISTLVEEYSEASRSDSVSSYHYRLLLLPHLESLLKKVSSGSDRVSRFELDSSREISLCSTLGSAYQLDGNHHGARQVLERALRVCEESDGKNSLQAAGIALKLGSSYRHLGMLSESEFVLEEALSIYRSQCGEVSVEVADTLACLSSTYNDRGTYNEGRKTLEQALEVYKTLYGPRHPLVGVALTSLGATWRNLGNSLKSKELFEESLAIQEAVYEPDHPSLAITLRNLSTAYSDLGQPNKSITLLQRALDINTRVHGPDHTTSAVILSNLSVAHRHLGNTHTSHELASQALKKMEDHSGTSPRVAIALGVLGTTYSDLGQLDKARELLRRSVQMNENFNGPQHIGTAIAQTDLGRVTRLAGDLQEARTILENALETKEKIQGKEHPSVGVTLTSLGKVYHELGHLTDSLLALQRSQEIREKLYAVIPNHPQVAFSQADQAKVLRDCGNLDQSANLMKEAIDRYTSNIDESSSLGYTYLHPKYASMMAIMGLILRDLNQLEEARKYLEESLAIQEKILSQESLLKAETLCNLGTVLHRMDDRQGSLQQLDAALRMIKTVKYWHPITATISAARAQLFLNMGDLNLAQTHMEEALTIRTDCSGEVHPNVALYHDVLAQILLMKDELLESQAHIAKALTTYQTLHTREARLSEQAGLEMAVLLKWGRVIQELTLQVNPNVVSKQEN